MRITYENYCSVVFHKRYDFEVSNNIGSVHGSVVLVVEEGEGDNDVNKKTKFESNPVKQKDFGEYVASLHAYNNSEFILQYQVYQLCVRMNVALTIYNYCHSP